VAKWNTHRIEVAHPSTSHVPSQCQIILSSGHLPVCWIWLCLSLKPKWIVPPQQICVLTAATAN